MGFTIVGIGTIRRRVHLMTFTVQVFNIRRGAVQSPSKVWLLETGNQNHLVLGPLDDTIAILQAWEQNWTLCDSGINLHIHTYTYPSLGQGGFSSEARGPLERAPLKGR